MLRRLWVVGLCTVCFCAPAAARPHVAAAGVASGRTTAAPPSPLPAPITVAIFYYPWYSTPVVDGTWEHWNQNAHRPPLDLYSRYYPARGPYSSDNPAVLERQMSQIAGAGIDEVIVSWWGRGSDEDRRLPAVMAAANRHGLAVAIHLEPYDGRSPATVEQDLSYLAGLGIRDVFVYHPLDFPASDWAAVRAAAPPGLRLFAGTPLVGFAEAGGFDGFYTYDFMTYGAAKFARLCEEAHAVHLLCAPSVGPGYDGRRAGEASPGRGRRNGQTYDLLWNAALQASPDMVTITSYNEWGEGTQIEPSSPHRGYLSYDGAWGLRGRAAQFAYLLRTQYWAALAHSH